MVAEPKARAVLRLVEVVDPKPVVLELSDPAPMLTSPELVLVLPEAERGAAIRSLPPPPVWSPEPLLPVVPAAVDAGAQRLAAPALVYFAAKLVWTVVTAAVYVVVIVAVVTMLSLIL